MNIEFKKDKLREDTINIYRVNDSKKVGIIAASKNSNIAEVKLSAFVVLTIIEIKELERYLRSLGREIQRKSDNPILF